MDAVADEFVIPDANVVVLQYVISHFYNNGQIAQINEFFQKLIDTIIAHKQKEVPMAILINDVNSNNRGRDFFSDLIELMKASDIHGRYSKYYFEETKPSEEIQEKVARDLEVIRLKDELYKESVLNKLTFIGATGLCNLSSLNHYYTRTYF